MTEKLNSCMEHHFYYLLFILECFNRQCISEAINHRKRCMNKHFFNVSNLNSTYAMVVKISSESFSKSCTFRSASIEH